MATILNKSLVRESTVEISNKAIIVTVKDDQSIELKLKGIRGGETLNISLIDLWEYLGGETPSDSNDKKSGAISIKKKAPKKGDNKMISLYDLRSANAISVLDVNDMVKFDGIISDMIKNLGL